MFVGHYSVSYAARSADRAVPLWILFLAVQLVDVFWSIFVLLGIEKVRIVPGITATNPLDLHYMPYTHSLPAAVGWALVGGAAYWAWRRSRRGALLVGGAVFSHWILDVVVHRPDLPLWGNAHKVGLGLWDHPTLALGLEAGLLLAGLAGYMARTRPAPGAAITGLFGMPVFAAAMVAMQVVVFFGAPPPTPAAAAVTALAAYAVLAGLAWWLEGKRIPAPAPGAS